MRGNAPIEQVVILNCRNYLVHVALVRSSQVDNAQIVEVLIHLSLSGVVHGTREISVHEAEIGAINKQSSVNN